MSYSRAFMAAILATSLVSCDATLSEGNADATTEGATQKAIDGFGELKFGSTLMATLAATGSERFNAYGVKECLDDLPLKGCFLSPASEAAPFLIEGGVPYELALDFNKFDKLTDIRLSYDREGKISFTDCLSIHERTIDWLTLKYGQLRPTLNDKEKVELRKTPSRNSYLVWRSKDGSFVTTPTRTAPSTLPVSVQRKPIPQWDNRRYLSILSSFIIVDGKPMCSVGIEFSEPITIERRPASEDTSSQPSIVPESEPEPDIVAVGEPMHGPYGDEDAQPLDGNAENANVETE